MKCKKKYYNRKPGVPPKSYYTAVEWDRIRHCPVYKNGIPYRKKNDPRRTSDGCFKSQKKHTKRSERKSEGILKKERHLQIKENREYKIKEMKTKNIGRGVKTIKKIVKDEIICTYVGELIDKKEAKKRDLKYEEEEKGSYIYYFRWNDTIRCIDATEENNTLGRLINHSKTKANIYTKLETIEGVPYLYFLAKEDIRPNTQILYDYNDPKSGLAWMME